jgi:hypothetical protein
VDLSAPSRCAPAASDGGLRIRLPSADITPANPIGLRLRVLESDRPDTARRGEGVPTLQGIGLGEAGQPAGYGRHRVHPGASGVLPGGATWLTSQRVPARDVLHLYPKRRPGHLPSEVHPTDTGMRCGREM